MGFSIFNPAFLWWFHIFIHYLRVVVFDLTVLSGQHDGLQMTVSIKLMLQDEYVTPLNAALNDQGQEVLDAPTVPDEYLPDVVNGAHGDNYFDNDWNLLYVMIRGPTPLEIRTSPMITLSFSMPAMTVDEFFGENIANNLALFLGIPAENIIVADAVAESRKRRKRDQSVQVGTHRKESTTFIEDVSTGRILIKNI